MLIGIGVAIVAFQVRSKVDTLLFLGVANIFQAVSVGLLLNWVAFSIFAVTIVRSFTFAFIEHRARIDKPVPQQIQLALVIAFMVAVIVTVSTTFEWWLDFLLLMASLFLVYGNWAKGPHLIRISALVFDGLFIVNHAAVPDFPNIAGIVFSSLMIFTVLVFYGRFFFSKPYRLQRLYTEQVSPDIPVSQVTSLPQGLRGIHTQSIPTDTSPPE